tara:strand:+ start:23545 stop:27621 length:4077 start_codon:yes stop_codon:yes gene_type:complete
MGTKMKRVLTAGLCLVATLAVFLKQQEPVSNNIQPKLSIEHQRLLEKISEEGEGEEKQDGYSRFAEFHQLLRTPDSKAGPEYDFNYKLKELEKSTARLANFRTLGTVLDWKSRGPGNIPGRTRALVIMPNDATGNTWLAGSAGGGVWKTTDSGASWTNMTPDLPNLAVATLAVCATSPAIIYAGTGEGFGNLDGIGGAGIFKSTDGGASWLQLASTVADNSFRVVNRIIVDPNNPNLVVVCANTSTNTFNTATSGIFRSTDGGATWTKVYTSNEPVQQVIAAPGDFSVQYAAVRAVGVLKSTDAGATWSATSSNLKSSGRIELAVSAKSPLKVAASAEGSLSGEAGADLFISEDGGTSWAYVSEKDDNNFDFLEQGDYDNAIMFHPFFDNVVYVAGVNIFKFTIDSSAPSLIKSVEKFEKTGTSSFIDFTPFNGNNLPGLEIGDIAAEELVDVEIRFGPGVNQLAARFTVNKQGAGVPAAQYLYKDYVEVPFQAWDVTNNKQLMVSFRDQQEDGEFTLIGSNTEGDGSTHSREYLFVHLVDYSTTVDAEIAKNGGHEHQMELNLWPVLASGGAWSPKNLPDSKLNITFSSISKLKKQVTIVADGYGEHTEFSGGSVVNPTSSIHVDHHSLTAGSISTSDSTFRIISSNDGGVYHSATGKDPGTANGDWTFSGAGMVTGQFYGVDKRPGADQYIGGLQDNSTNISQEGTSPGGNASYTRVIGGDGFDAVWNYGNAAQVIGSAQFNTFFKSSNFGAPGSWTPAVSGLPQDDTETDFPFFSRLGNAKSVPEVLFCVGINGVYRSTDFGDKWVPSQMDADWSYRGSFTNVEVSQANSMIVWAGGAMSSSQTLQVSTDRGKTFKKVNNYTGNAQLKGVITGIATHPAEDSTAYVLFSFAGLPKVVVTNDLGQTWRDLSGFESSTSGVAGFPDVAVYSLLVLPNDPSVIWAGTEIGIFESADDGQSWTRLAGLPAVSVWEMKVVDDQVVIATHGRGIYTAQLSIVPEVIMAPFIQSLGVKPSGLVNLEAQLRSPYDSTQVLVNSQAIKTLGPNTAGVASVDFFIDGETEIEVALRSFKSGKQYVSISKSAVSDLRTPSLTYASNFDDAAASVDFTGNGFSLSKPIGFLSSAIHSTHSYDEDTTYIYKLRTPIIISAENPTFKYRDIAIIETGETGTVFGDDEFYDYVVVEGSVDGVDWKPIEEGYDASYNAAWLTTYNNEGMGNEGLYVQHTANLLDTFNAGDTVIFRFRLFSDQLSNAWGWSIDDLKIQTESDNTLTSAGNSLDEWSLYPNPAGNFVTLGHPDSDRGLLGITIFNMGGQKMLQKEMSVISKSTEVNLTTLEPGIYVLIANFPNGEKKFRFLKE